MRRCAMPTNRYARTCPRSTALTHGSCRWPGPFWSISQGLFAWPLSMLTSRAALTRQSSSSGSTNSKAKAKGPPHDPLPPRGVLSVEYVPGRAVSPLEHHDDLAICVVCFYETMGVRNVLKWEDLHRPRLIGSVSHSIDDLLHGNVGVRKVLRAKQ